MTKDITRQDYIDEIHSIVDMIMLEYDIKSEDDFYEALHQVIDGHEWIIYYCYPLKVLDVCISDADIGIENGTVDAKRAMENGGLNSLHAQLAYSAMFEDCMNRHRYLEEEKQGA